MVVHLGPMERRTSKIERGGRHIGQATRDGMGYRAGEWNVSAVGANPLFCAVPLTGLCYGCIKEAWDSGGTALGPSGGAASPISNFGGKPRLAMSAAAKGEGGGTTDCQGRGSRAWGVCGRYGWRG